MNRKVSPTLVEFTVLILSRAWPRLSKSLASGPHVMTLARFICLILR